MFVVCFVLLVNVNVVFVVVMFTVVLMSVLFVLLYVMLIVSIVVVVRWGGNGLETGIAKRWVMSSKVDVRIVLMNIVSRGSAKDSPVVVVVVTM